MLHIKDFLKSPYRTKSIADKSIKYKLGISFVWLMYGIAISGIINAIITAVMTELGYVYSPDEFQKGHLDLIESIGKPQYLMAAIIIGPIYEEFAFRYGLSFKKRELAVSLALLIGLFSISYEKFFHNPLEILNTLSVIVVFFLIFDRFFKQSYFDKLSLNNRNRIIYLGSVIFALIHILNLQEFEIVYMPYYLVYVLPLFVLAMISSFLRINLGIVYSMGFHISWNLFASLSILFNN